jgi:hypothetical protein
MKRGPVAAFDLVPRPPASVSLLRALGDHATVAVIDSSHDVAVADVLAWLEGEAVVVYSGPGGDRWERPVGGLVVARFRHWDSRHRMPLLHDHLVVSVKVLRAGGKWGHLDSRRLYAHVVAAGALYNQRILEEVCDRLGLATEPRRPTPGLRPVMAIAGVPPELIAWSSTRQRDIAALLEQAEADYTADHGYPPTARVRARLMKLAVDGGRPVKKTPLPLPELRRRWRADAIRRLARRWSTGCSRCAAAPRQRSARPGTPPRRPLAARPRWSSTWTWRSWTSPSSSTSTTGSAAAGTCWPKPAATSPASCAAAAPNRAWTTGLSRRRSVPTASTSLRRGGRGRPGTPSTPQPGTRPRHSARTPRRAARAPWWS